MFAQLQTRLLNRLLDLFQYRLIRYVIPGCIGFVVTCLGLFSDWSFFRPRFGNGLDLVLSPMTFAVTTMIFLNQVKYQLEQELPKFLFVDFLYGGKIVMRAEDFTLIHEGDIRNWAQQIGLQMNEGKQLKIATLDTPRTEILSRESIRIRRYTIRIQLAELPSRHLENFPEPIEWMIVRTQSGLDTTESVRNAIHFPIQLPTIPEMTS